MRYDGGYGRGFRPGGVAFGQPRGYDYGLRGFRDTAPQRPPVRVRQLSGLAGGYDAGYGVRPHLSNRVTQRYNREYVHPAPNRLETNYAAFGGDFEGRIVDPSGYWRPYSTQGGSRTMRGGGLPMGWEREADHARYDAGFRGYGRDYHRPMH